MGILLKVLSQPAGLVLAEVIGISMLGGTAVKAVGKATVKGVKVVTKTAVKGAQAGGKVVKKAIMK